MVMALPGLRIGLNCTIELDDDDGSETEGYKSRIEDMRDDQLFVAWPSRRGQNVMVSIGDMVYLTIPTTGGSTLFLDCEVAARIPGSAGSVAMLAVRVLAVGRQQQRMHYRLYVTLLPIDCAVWYRDFGQSEAEGYWRPIAATVTDLSGGGVGLNSDDVVQEGARIRLRFPYPAGTGDFLVEARIAKCIPSSAGGRTRYKVGTQFEQMDRVQRERLLRCIHRFQVEQRRRENARPGPSV